MRQEGFKSGRYSCTLLFFKPLGLPEPSAVPNSNQLAAEFGDASGAPGEKLKVFVDDGSFQECIAILVYPLGRPCGDFSSNGRHGDYM